MNPRYGTQNVLTSILKYCTYRLWKQSGTCTISVSVCDILFNPCACECFRFFLAANS